MKNDLRYKNAPLFAVSIVLFLSATTIAEAAPVAVKANNTQRPNNPDEAVRAMVTAQLGQVGASQPASSFPRPSEIVPTPLKKGTQQSAPIVTGTAASTTPQAIKTVEPASSSVNPLGRILTGITNRSSGQAIPQAIYVPASPQTQSARPATPPISRPASSSALSEANASLTPTFDVPVSDLPFPDVETKSSPAQEQSKAARTTFIAQQPSDDKMALSSNQWTMGGIRTLTSNLVSNSKKMVLSIRSDSSDLFAMGSVRMEIPSAFSSRLILGNTFKNSELPNLSSNPDSLILSIQIPRRGNNTAMRLLLTQKGAISDVSKLVVGDEDQKSVAFSLIGTHRFSNKPNV